MNNTTYQINVENLRTYIDELKTLVESFEEGKEKDHPTSNVDDGQAHFWLQEINAEIESAETVLKTLIQNISDYMYKIAENVTANDQINAKGQGTGGGGIR